MNGTSINLGSSNIKNALVKNIILFTLGEAFWGFQASLIASATVLTVLLREYGASDRIIGTIGTIEAGLLVLPQLIGLWLFSSTKTRKRYLLLWHYFAIIPFLFAAAFFVWKDDLFSRQTVIIALLLSFALYIGGIGVVISTWVEWFASLFDSRIRGTVMGVSWFASAFMGTCGGLLAGWMISCYHHDAFFIFYFAAGIVAVFSITCFAFVKDPAEEGPSDEKKVGLKIILAKFRESMGDSNFRAFLVGRIMASLGFCVIPFFAVYFQSEAGGSLSGAVIVACGSAMTFGMAVANLILGRMGDRHGHRIGIIIGTAMQVVTMVLILFGWGMISCVLVYFSTGICMGSSFLSHTNMLLETCPHDHRIAHITVGNLVLSLPMLFAPFIAGLAIESMGLTVVFTVCLFINVLAALWMLFRVKEPRYVEISKIMVS